jgi:hypothetical protein
MPKDSEIWSPFLFCTGLSLINLVSEIAVYASTGVGTLSAIAFLCFLPICFLLVGVMLKKLRSENIELRSKLEEISQKLQ